MKEPKANKHILPDNNSVNVDDILLLQSKILFFPANKDLTKLLYTGLTKIPWINFVSVRIGSRIQKSKTDSSVKSSLEKFDNRFITGLKSQKRTNTIQTAIGKNGIVLFIANSKQIYGYIFIEAGNKNIFKVCKPFLENLSKSVTQKLENQQKSNALKNLNNELKRKHKTLETKLNNNIKKINEVNKKLKREIRERNRNEKELQQEQLRSMVEGAPDPIFIQTEKKFAYLNLAACRLFGIKSPVKLLGKPILERVHPDYHTLIKERFQRVNKENKSVRDLTELRFLRINGSEIWVETTVEPIFYEGKNGALVILRDVTKRIEISRALHESEEKWQFALEGAGDGIWDWQVKTNKVYFSPKWKSMLGYKDHELANTHDEWEKRVHPDDKEKSNADIRKHFPGKTETYINEHRLLCKDGTYKWILARGKIIKRDEKGKPLRFIGTHTDINEKKLAEIKLEMFQYGIDHIQIGVYQVDEDGKIIYANREAARSLGYTHEELIGKSLFEIDTTFNFQIFTKHRKILKTQGNRIINSIHKRKDGSEFPVEVSVNYIKFGDNFFSFLFVKDITERVESEEKLRESRENLSITLHSIGDAVISTDVKGNIVLMNPVAEKLCGWKYEKAKGKPLSDIFRIINSKTRKRIENPVNLVIESGKRIGLANHTVLLSKDGNEYQISDSAAPIFDKSGKITGAVLVFSDVTEEYVTREALKESEANLSKAELMGNFGNWEINLVTDKITGSKGASLVYGLPKKDWKLKDIQKLTLPNYRKQLNESLHLLITAGKPYDIEYEIKRPDNKIRFVHSTASYDAKRKKVFGIIHDITERKRAEEALAKSEKEYKEFFKKDLTGDFLATVEGKIVDCNPAYLRILGYASIDDIQKHSTRKLYVDPKERDDMIALIKKEKEVSDYEMHMLRTDGKEITVIENIIGVFDDKNNLTHLRGYLFDITIRKKVELEMLKAKEKAEVADRMKTEFLAQMSHEIRSPLNAVLSLTGIVKDVTKGMNNEDLSVCFSGIDSASKRIIRTIDSILNMSDLQLGTYQVTKRKINLIQLLQNLVGEYESIALGKNLDLRFIYNTDKTFVDVDDYALNQIIANLIDNAVKYTPKGFVEIRLRLDDKIKIEIQDTGIGISEEFLPLIFSPFSQEKQGYTREYEGNGLGMSLVKNYCDLIGAEISVESNKNQGTTFTLFLNCI